MERDDQPQPGWAQQPEGGTGGYDPVRGLGGEPPRPEKPTGAAPPWSGDDDADDEASRTERARRDPSAIRAEDTEPYIGLQYVARLFKIVAMVVIVALTAEIVAALVMEGPSALLPLILEILQGAVLAAVLWGASDLTLLFIDVGHDVRAARVLLGRMSARAGSGYDTALPNPSDQRRTPRGGGDEYVG
ncbi:MAG: hypothetical protein JO306_17360 [Gemmatimonadetes bacterium]|nr:hypothetical protein [Gemmatimonadota bacterium]